MNILIVVQFHYQKCLWRIGEDKFLVDCLWKMILAIVCY